MFSSIKSLLVYICMILYLINYCESLQCYSCHCSSLSDCNGITTCPNSTQSVFLNGIIHSSLVALLLIEFFVFFEHISFDNKNKKVMQLKLTKNYSKT